MSLEGAKIIRLSDDDDDHSKLDDVVPACGKTFKFGYYMDCDIVLEHPDAIGVHCAINCDAFGRVTIENCCPEQPITLGGKVLRRMRPLHHNTEIGILDKKFLWCFEGSRRQSIDSDPVDRNDMSTPRKAIVTVHQAPNSEPARRWRTEFQKRMTINNFAHYFKAEEKPQATGDRDENMSPLIEIESVSPKKAATEFPKPVDLIDLQTPKVSRKSFNNQRTPLSCCNLSETVITSYSPRETGVRPEKSFAIVQKPRITSANLRPHESNMSLGPFHNMSSPLTLSHRPSMHLIDLTTPMKGILPCSPSRTRDKPNPRVAIPATQKQGGGNGTCTPSSQNSSVYSVISTDNESVIEISDEPSSPSHIIKTPSRPRTPQSLMKRAILSSAKKAAVAKRLHQPTLPFTPRSLSKTIEKNAAQPAGSIRFHDSSARSQTSTNKPSPLPGELLKQPNKVNSRFMTTSTPFRPAHASDSTPRRSIMRSPSTSFTSGNNKSRTSLILKQALSATSPDLSKRKSVSFSQSNQKTTSSVGARKSSSFLNVVENQQANKSEPLNTTFSIEEEHQPDQTDKIHSETTPKKNATFSPEKQTADHVELPHITSEIGEKNVCINVLDSSGLSLVAEESIGCATPTGLKPTETHSSLKQMSTKKDSLQQSPTQPNQGQLDGPKSHDELESDPLESSPPDRLHFDNDSPEYDDFEGLDMIFKTPKARNLMVLSSPKSVALQKATTAPAERIDPADYDLSTNLEDIFKTPQSEFVTNQIDTDDTICTQTATMFDNDNEKQLSPEEKFDKLVGRPSITKSYARKSTSLRRLDEPLEQFKDSSLPKTDIEEWIDSVSECILTTDDSQMALSKDPLTLSVLSQSTTTLDSKIVKQSLSDETEITIQEENNEGSGMKANPLELTPTHSKRSVSPNISGIDLLDRTPESTFSETLAVSDDSSSKEHDKVPEVTATDNLESDDNISPNKARIEMERAFEHFESERKKLVNGRRLASTPDTKKPVQKITQRRTLGNQITSNAFFDLKALKSEREKEAFENIKTSPTEEKSKYIGKAERRQAFQMFDEKSKSFNEKLIKTPEHATKLSKDYRRTLNTNFRSEVTIDLNAARQQREIELAFENFEEEPQPSEERPAKTPEPKQKTLKDKRRTMGSNLGSEVTLDLNAARQQREIELAFENFEEEPKPCEERSAKTPEPKQKTLKENRRTMGSNLGSEVTLDLNAARQQREIELAFENFEEEPKPSEERIAKTPEPKQKTLKDKRRTMGSNLGSEVTLDLNAARQQREIELAFKNFEEEPKPSEERSAKTPEPKQKTLKDKRRTMGSNLGSEVTLDLNAARQQREIELAFENFEEEPKPCEERSAKTPEPKQKTLKDKRRTMGNNLGSEVTLDLNAARQQREIELAFENFEEEPKPCEERSAKTPEPKQKTLKDKRRTMGSNLGSEVTLDLNAARQQREIELAFENFEEEPKPSEERSAKTPEPKQKTLKDKRRTMGSNLGSEVTLDLNAARQQREIELAFENFEEEPKPSEERSAKTPEPKQKTLKDKRRTMGSNLGSEVTLDLNAARQQREIELAFENFDEEPQPSEERIAKTPEPKQKTLKDKRRTMGSNLGSEVTLDLNAARQQREIELAFKNFEEEPKPSEERSAKTPEPKQKTLKENRRTMGSNLGSEMTLDLNAARQQREIELAFENFEEEPKPCEERSVKTPEPKQKTLKDNRRTMGSNLGSEVTLDLNAARQQREIELAFENFEEEPKHSEGRSAKTPEPKQKTLKDKRRTMGSNLGSEVTLDLNAVRQQREIELAFENFEEEPQPSEERIAKTPEPKQKTLKDKRRTMGSNLGSEVTLDLNAARQQREIELAFENFEEEPKPSEERSAKTPEPKQKTLKENRRTMGSNLGSEVTLDLNAARQQREIELAFENFEEEPKPSEERSVKTPEPKQKTLKDNRRTMGSNLGSEVTLDLNAARQQREIELAFENFEEEPKPSEERSAKTPEPKQKTLKDKRRTMGSNLGSEVTLDLNAARQQREIELAFENFEEEPKPSKERSAKTPEPKQKTLKDKRRTMGSNLGSEVTLDLNAARQQREIELAFENFEEEPKPCEERSAKTPEPKQKTLKENRRTMGSNLGSEVTLDLNAARQQREIELAFENFEEEPKPSEERSAKTPEPKQKTLKDKRRTMGSNLGSEVTLDLNAARQQREIELAFENFDEEPKPCEERIAKTPEPKQKTLEDKRRTMGSNLGSEVTLDLNAARQQREIELAFENFDEEPKPCEERSAKTPEPKQKTLKENRRTMGSNLGSEVTLDLNAARQQREIELAFENFEEEPKPCEERSVKTPEPKQKTLKDNRRTMGSNLGSDTIFDLKAAKKQRQREQAFTNVELGSKDSEEGSPEIKQKLKSNIDLIEEEMKDNTKCHQLANAKSEDIGEDRCEERKVKEESSKKKTDIELGKAESPVVVRLRPTRRRKKNTDEEDGPKDSQNVDKIKPQPQERPRLRTRRHNSVDSLTKSQKVPNDDSAVNKNNAQVTLGSTEQELLSNTQNSSVAIDQISIQSIEHDKSQALPNLPKGESEDMDSTEDETKPVSVKRTRRRKPLSDQLAVQTTDEPHHLDPIAEEEKQIKSPTLDIEKSAKSSRLRTGRRALSKNTEDVSTLMATLNLKVESEEVVAPSPVPSTTRIRGRKALLKVTLLESQSPNEVSSIKVEPLDESLRDDDPGHDRTLKSANTSLEIIPSTPAQPNTRRRALVPKADPLDSSAPALKKSRNAITLNEKEETVQVRRRGRKAIPKSQSPILDALKSEDNANDENIVASTPLSSEARGGNDSPKSKSAVESSTPLRRGTRRKVAAEAVTKKEVLSEKDLLPCTEDVEEFVPSTPAPAIPRTRKLTTKTKQEEPVMAQELIAAVVPSTFAENVTPSRKGSRRGAKSVDTKVETSGLDATHPIDDPNPVQKEVMDVSQPASIPARKRGGKMVQQTEQEKIIEEKTQTNSLENQVSANASTVTTRTRRAAYNSVQSATPTKKHLRGRKNVDQDMKDHTEQEDVQTEDIKVSSKDRGIETGIKTELTEASIETLSPIRKKSRKAIQENALDTSASSITMYAKTEASDSEQSAQPASASSRKRTRRVALQTNSIPKNSTPKPKRRGRKPASELTLSQRDDGTSCAETTVEPDAEAKSTGSTRRRSESVKEEDSSKPNESLSDKIELKKSVRSRRNQTSQPEAQISLEPDEKIQKRHVRGRKMQPETDTAIESGSHGEGGNSISTSRTRQLRNQKATMEDGNSDKGEVKTDEGQKSYSTRTRRANTAKHDLSDVVAPDKIGNEDKSEAVQQDAKKTRGRKPAQKKMPVAENKSITETAMQRETTSESNATVDSENEQSQPKAQKKATRSRKASAKSPINKTSETIASRKGNLRNVEQTDSDTPSKRPRRKPNILQSGEYVS